MKYSKTCSHRTLPSHVKWIEFFREINPPSIIYTFPMHDSEHYLSWNRPSTHSARRYFAPVYATKFAQPPHRSPTPCRSTSCLRTLSFRCAPDVLPWPGADSLLFLWTLAQCSTAVSEHESACRTSPHPQFIGCLYIPCKVRLVSTSVSQ